MKGDEISMNCIKRDAKKLHSPQRPEKKGIVCPPTGIFSFFRFISIGIIISTIVITINHKSAAYASHSALSLHRRSLFALAICSQHVAGPKSKDSSSISLSNAINQRSFCVYVWAL